MIHLLNLFKRDRPKRERPKDDYIGLSYFECEDSVEAALNYLDNHPNCTLEEYEEWLRHREEAIKKIKENDN